MERLDSVVSLHMRAYLELENVAFEIVILVVLVTDLTDTSVPLVLVVLLTREGEESDSVALVEYSAGQKLSWPLIKALIPVEMGL